MEMARCVCVSEEMSYDAWEDHPKNRVAEESKSESARATVSLWLRHVRQYTIIVNGFEHHCGTEMLSIPTRNDPQLLCFAPDGGHWLCCEVIKRLAVQAVLNECRFDHTESIGAFWGGLVVNFGPLHYFGKFAKPEWLEPLTIGQQFRN